MVDILQCPYHGREDPNLIYQPVVQGYYFHIYLINFSIFCLFIYDFLYLKLLCFPTKNAWKCDAASRDHGASHSRDLLWSHR